MTLATRIPVGMAEMTPEARTLLTALRGFVGAKAHVIRDGDVTKAVTWSVPGGRMALVRHGEVVGQHEAGGSKVDPQLLVRESPARGSSLSMLMRRGVDARPHPIGSVDAFLREVASRAPGPLLAEMAELGIYGLRSEIWLSDPDLGGRRLAACRRNPWLADRMAADLGGGEFPADLVDGLPPADAGAAYAGAWLKVPRDGAEWLCAAMDAMPPDREGIPQFLDFRPRKGELALMASMPSRLRPGAGRIPGGEEQMAAALLVSSELERCARPTGRDPVSVAGTVTDWVAYAHRCADRATGIRDSGERHFLQRYRQATRSLNDMLGALVSEVIGPAFLGAGGGRAAWDGTFKPARYDAAIRLTLGERTLPALMETSRDWHAGVGAATLLLTELRGPEFQSGPRAFGDVDLGDGTYATCLHRFPDLAGEGMRGPDADGNLGLNHCVATYTDRVAAGSTVIASIRRREPGGGFVRLYTAELDFRQPGPPLVVQRGGPRNAYVPAREVDALVSALAPISDDVRTAISRWRPSGNPLARHDTVALVHEAGAWERMRDLWAFALPRHLRQAGPEAILEAAGLRP